MALKTVYQPKTDEIGVSRVLIEYTYYPGFALSQKQKSIQSLHDAARQHGIKKMLEISSKSPDEIGIKLSAFNLKIAIQSKQYSVEQVFQSSKVFENGGPFLDLLDKTSKEAKTDLRLKTSGSIVSFSCFGEPFPTKPLTFFYDWLYSNALLQNKHLLQTLSVYDGFSDIEFNEKKSINCQAYSLALFCSLLKNKPSYINETSIRKDKFLSLTINEYHERWK